MHEYGRRKGDGHFHERGALMKLSTDAAFDRGPLPPHLAFQIIVSVAKMCTHEKKISLTSSRFESVKNRLNEFF